MQDAGASFRANSFQALKQLVQCVIWRLKLRQLLHQHEIIGSISLSARTIYPFFAHIYSPIYRDFGILA